MADVRKPGLAFPTTSENVAKLAIVGIALLIVVKAVASAITGSVGIMADAVHSFIDLSGAVVALIGIKVSAKPPDQGHAFGHGKAENISSVVISALIFAAGFTVAYEAVRRLIDGVTVELAGVGIGVTAVAIVVNVLMSRYAMRVASISDSLALEATARDMMADVLSSCAVLVGLVLVGLTGRSVFDPAVALLVAVLIIRAAFVTLKRSFGGLMDARLPDEEEEAIRACIMQHCGHVVGFHRLRTRKAGSDRHIDLHVVMPKNASVEEAHQVCDHLEQDIAARLTGARVNIHVEPCSLECHQCLVSCSLRRKDR